MHTYMICVCGYDICVYQCKHSVEVSGQLWGGGSLLSGLWGLNLGHQALKQVLSSAKPSSWPNMGFNQNVFQKDLSLTRMNSLDTLL